MKTISLYAMVAAGVIVGGAAFSLAPAKAADLGGSGDLEERVAELEATTVRKGNRKVSLELYGQVNRALLMWDDGRSRDSYVVDNQNTPSRFGLKGNGTIASGWKSGFWLEFDVNDANSSAVTQSNLNGTISAGDEGGNENAISTRQANVWVENDRLGRVTVGHGSPATDDLTLINLSGASVATDGRGLWNSSFRVRGNDGGALMQWRHIVSGLDTDRGDFARYDSPSLFGFVLSTAWGENDQWDVALRFKQEVNSFRFAAGIGYYYQGDWAGAPTLYGAGYGAGDNTRREEIKGSLSAMHVPTGLYVSFAAGERYNEAVVGAYNPDQGFWYLQGGVDRKFFPVGNTTLYGEYGNYSDFGAGNRTRTGGDNATTAGLVSTNRSNVIANSDVDRWGLGVVQKFDASALEIYGLYQHFAADISAFNAAGTGAVDVPTLDFDAVSVGARVKF